MIGEIRRRCCVERTQSRRNQVLEAAECCFARSGFHGASMAEISKAAGMSAGHIYNYFESKDDIIAAFVQRNMDRVSVIMSEIEARDDPLQAMLDDLEVSVREKFDPATWTLLTEIQAEASRNPKIARLVQENDHLVSERFREVIRKGRMRRGLDIDEVALEGCVEVMSAMFQGLHLRQLLNPQLDQVAVTAALRLALTPLLFGE